MASLPVMQGISATSHPAPGKCFTPRHETAPRTEINAARNSVRKSTSEVISPPISPRWTLWVHTSLRSLSWRVCRCRNEVNEAVIDPDAVRVCPIGFRRTSWCAAFGWLLPYLGNAGRLQRRDGPALTPSMRIRRCVPRPTRQFHLGGCQSGRLCPTYRSYRRQIAAPEWRTI